MPNKCPGGWACSELTEAPRSRVLARLATLAQIGELARRLVGMWKGEQLLEGGISRLGCNVIKMVVK